MEDNYAFHAAQYGYRLLRPMDCALPRWLKQESIDESNYRDEMHRLLQYFDFISIREAHSEAGRTDLLVSDKNDTTKMLRMEFKIWGRHDYDQIPEKPLKYFVDGENIAIVVMINPNKKKPINDNYRTNVSSSPTGCVGIIHKPFEQEFFPDHFISLHERNNYYAEVLHIILNRYGPFAIKQF